MDPQDDRFQFPGVILNDDGHGMASMEGLENDR